MIYYNVFIDFESIHTMRKKRTRKKGDVVLKIDISKAYDRFDWRFLDGILYRWGLMRSG